MSNDFLVLGDLGGDRYIVRMFVGTATYDEEFTSPLDSLGAKIQSRITELSQSPVAGQAVEASRPAVDPGNAVDLGVAT